MAERLILCSGCGAKNRISPGGSGQPKCGACGKALAVPGYSQGGLVFFKKPLTWLVVGGLVLGGYQWIEESKDSGTRAARNAPTGSSVSLRLAEPAKPIFDAPPVQASAGVMRSPPIQGVAPLKIKSRNTHEHLILRHERWHLSASSG